MVGGLRALPLLFKSFLTCAIFNFKSVFNILIMLLFMVFICKLSSHLSEMGGVDI